MKKTYSKPEIVFESFVMSSSIANDCGEYKANLGNGEDCVFEDNENGFSCIVFTNDDCTRDLCYQVPNLNAVIFSS